ncbi:MAG: hypothetical protein J6B31_02135 [Bacteroidaceae bacterium]|nr:hypothetical protein [Bacteroidaceae bacterium]
MAKNMLLNNVQLDSETAFFTNGDINLYACPWNETPSLTNGKRTSYRGRITVMSNGDAHIKAYHLGSQGPKRELIFSTEHCRVFLYPSGKIIEQWEFDKKLSFLQIFKIRKAEGRDVNAFFNTMKIDYER